ncbi:Sigma-70 region 4 type 2 [Paenibacillus curdlanolyticus YK9]|uniref:Sigma-70 region 4 type 2 n=1 Tax=Paenibacillus curdlanolyticus YK9 TaxID=717606 RepID=E0IBS8_9BACL|nr:phage terminase small subunit [Paenibacillus curdlanolyticus]EFM10158.1 Sigma-70 region 4 type 2 [Paenibacillus curdlanolyticus YK9]
MAETHKLAEQDYQAGLKYREIAEKHGVTLNTVKSWKQRHGWERNKGAPSVEGVHTKRGGAPKGNKNAVGNNGGAPARNSNAVTHGLFQKYLPAESLEIMGQLQERSPIDIVWDNIMIQYTAIIRAQQIMYVKDRDDKTVERIEEKSGNVFGEKWEVQQAWDKQATFLQAQSRAMSTLQSLIKQYDELLKTDLATEEQRARIEVLKSKVPNKDGVDPNAQITALAELINNPASERVLSDD